MRILLIGLLLAACAGAPSPEELTENLRSDSKLAYTIKNYQVTSCKQGCLVDESDFVENCYTHSRTEKRECVKECPLYVRQFLCVDLQKEEGAEDRFYVITPAEWQADVAHLSGIYFNEQLLAHIHQLEFLCEQDLAVCENHYELLEAIQKFHYEIKESK